MADNNVKIILEAVNQTKQAFNEVESQGTKALNGLKTSMLAFAAAGAAIFGVIKSLQAFVAEAAEAEEIENRLKFALESAGYTWQHAKGSVDDFANSIQKMTRFSDEEARKALTDMMLYTRDFSKAQDGARLAMDMSIRTGQDLGSTTRYIGMAMNGSVEVLSRFIPELRNLDERLGSNATAAQKAEYAIKVLNEKFGGTAQADLNTYAGKVKQFENAWSDLKEVIGNEFLPIMKEAVTWITKATKAMTEFFGGGGEKTQLERQLKAIETQMDQIAQAALTSVGQIFPGTKEYEQLVELEQERQDILEKIRSLTLQERESRRQIAAETKKDVLPSGKGGKEEGGTWKALEENARAWGEYAQAELDALEKMFTAEANKRASTEPMLDDEQKALGENARAWGEYAQAELDALEKMFQDKAGIKDQFKETAESVESEWTGVANQIGSAFQSGFFDLFKKGFSDLGDVASQFFENLSESALRAISQIATNLAIFGNVKGDASSGSGLVGLLGSLFSSFIPAQHGASFWTRGPTPMMVGEGGESEFVSVTPKSKMNRMAGSGESTVIIVQAYDAKSTDDFIRRNTGGFVKAMKRFNRGAGSTKNQV